MEVPHKNELLHMVLKAETTEITAVSPQEGSPIAFTRRLECLTTKTSERVPDNHVDIFSSYFWFLLQQTKAILRMGTSVVRKRCACGTSPQNGTSEASS
jgi:hypothetical protein